MGRPPNNYSDTQKSAALIAYDICEDNAEAAARWCKEHNGFSVSHDQILRWVKGISISPETREFATRKKGELADKFEDIAHIAADALPVQMEYANARDLMIIAATATDKMRLLREQSTQNVAHSLTVEERAERIEAIFENVRQRRLAALEQQTIEAEFDEEIPDER